MQAADQKMESHAFAVRRPLESWSSVRAFRELEQTNYAFAVTQQSKQMILYFLQCYSRSSARSALKASSASVENTKTVLSRMMWGGSPAREAGLTQQPGRGTHRRTIRHIPRVSRDCEGGTTRSGAGNKARGSCEGRTSARFVAAPSGFPSHSL